MTSGKPLYVTQPALPPLEEFLPHLEKIWENRILTNGGPFHQRLEQELCDYLGVSHLSLFNNGTVALLIALQTLRITGGEVITTPYSFVATAHSLLWSGITPVFADVDAQTLNLDPDRIEDAITPQTRAIMPVHCYGRPCDTERIERIGRRHGVKVIYDAAHAFSVRYKGESVLRFGDLNVLSFHATKVFNTFEGGAIVSPDAATKARVDQLKNFGFETEITVPSLGINGKMSEINAAFGIVQLRHVGEALESRRAIDTRYRELLADMPGIDCMRPVPAATANYAYFPVLVRPPFGIPRDALHERLAQSNIFTRRYFYPLISDFPMYRALPSARRSNLPVASAAADSVLCLPMSSNMEIADADRVVAAMRAAAARA